MEKVYKYFEIAAGEGSYRVRSDTVAQNNCFTSNLLFLLWKTLLLTINS